MFREMRRRRQQLSPEECAAVLRRGTAGVLALEGDGGYPYAVPLNYLYREGKFYFHCAVSGHKLDAIARNKRASFCVVDQAQVVPEELATHYRSVIAFGEIRVMEPGAAMESAALAFGERFAPDFAEKTASELQRELPRLCMLEMTVAHMTGKEALGLRQEQ